MQKKIKLIWDFRGSESLPIAEHHRIHLDEFIVREKLDFQETGIHKVSPMYTIAYMMVSEAQMILVRDALKPHRGELITIED